MLMMLMLFCMVLIAYEEDNNSDDDSYGNNNDNDNVAPCCLGCYATFKTPPTQKHSCFLGFQTSQWTPTINKHNRLKVWYLRHFRKKSRKKQDQTTMDKNSEASSC